MGPRGTASLETEFGRYAGWLAQAIAGASGDPIPAACRGTGNPALFERLAGLLDVTPGTEVLDLGCGIGGPGAWLARRCRFRVVGVDVMEPAVRGLKLLFPEMAAAVAAIESLPFAAGTFEAAWALGVLELFEDKKSPLTELYRVLRPEGRAVVYSLVSVEGDLGEVPRADHFTGIEDLLDAIDATGFEVVYGAPVEDLPPAPEDWRARRSEIRTRVWQMHGDDPHLQQVELDLARIARVVASGAVHPWEILIRKPA